MLSQGKYWVQITSRLNSLEGSDDFACACVCVEFRFHLGHPCCLRLCPAALALASPVKTSLKFAVNSKLSLVHQD